MRATRFSKLTFEQYPHLCTANHLAELNEFFRRLQRVYNDRRRLLLVCTFVSDSTWEMLLFGPRQYMAYSEQAVHTNAARAGSLILDAT